MTTKRHIGAGAAAIVTALTITVLGAAPAMAADTAATTTDHAQTAQPAAHNSGFNLGCHSHR
jgi:hypothetical protein